MTRRLVFVHTVPSLVDLFTRLSRELLPLETEIWHIADEILAKVVLARARGRGYRSGWSRATEGDVCQVPGDAGPRSRD